MNNATQARRLDQALLLGSAVNVSADTTLTYVYAAGNATAVNTSTWQTQNDVYQVLRDCYGYSVSLWVAFAGAVFTTTNSKVEVTVRQKRFTTDTVTTAPVIGAATLCASKIETVGAVGLKVPLSFVRFADAQASHGLFVVVDTTTVTLTTANIWLIEGDNVTS